MPSQEILKIRDGTPLEAEEILTYIKCPRNGSVCYFYSKLDVSSNAVQKKKVARILFFKIRSSQGILKIRDVARILFFKIRPSQEILKIRDGTPLEAEEILTYIKCPRNGSVCYFSSKLDVPSNVVQKKRVARILFFKIWSSQGILKVRDCTLAEEILTYIKSPRNGSVCYFSSKLDVPSNVVHKKRVARILFFKIRQSQEILKIRDGTPLEAEEILTYTKCPRNGSVCYFYSKLDVSSNVVQKKKVARILFFKIRSSQGILKIRDGAPMELDVPSNVVQKKRVARILFFKIRPSQEILEIRDGTPLEAEEILTYIKCPRNGSVCYFYSKLDAEEILTYIKSPRNGSICYFSSMLDVPKILKIRDGTFGGEGNFDIHKMPSKRIVQKKRVARILFFKIRPSQEILKIRDGTPLEAEEILTYIKCPRNGSVCYFYSKLDSSQGIQKVRDCTPMEAEEILTYIKSPRNGSICYFSSKLDVPSNVVQKKRVAEEILTYIKSPRNGSVCYFSSKLDVPSNVVQKKRVARILFFKIRPSQEILKIRDGTPLEAEEILTYIKCPRNGSVCYFYSKLDVSSNVVQKKKVARILFFKIRSSQGILKIRDGTPMEAESILTYIKCPRNGSVCYFSSRLDVPSNVVQKKRVARILFVKIWSSQGILKVRDCTPMEAEEILTYIKCPRNGSVCYFSSKLDVPSNVVQKKRVARILFYKISPRNGSVCYFSSKLDVPSNVIQKKRVARILFFKIRPSQEILKIRDGTPLEAEEILTYIKCPRNGSVCYFYSKLDVSSNVVQKKKVARILFFKIRSSQGILKILARILFFKIWSSQGILKVRDCTPMEAEEILTYIKSPRNGSVCYFSSKPSQEILKIRDGTPLEAEEILTYIKSPRNGSVCYFSSKLDVPSNVVQKKRVARILFFKIRPSQEILKIRDGTPLEAEEILTYIKCPRNGSVCYFYSKLDVSSNVVQKKKVARILFFKIRSSQGILKIRDGAPMEAEEILTYIKNPRNGSVCYFSSKLDVPSNVIQKKRVARILFFKIRPSQEILKIRDGTPLEAEVILTYIKCPRNGSVCYFYSKLDVSSNVVQKKKVARILFFKIRSSQGILKIRDGAPIEA
ncbi:hypothetical protein OROMI_024874 [Orobanche minor]